MGNQNQKHITHNEALRMLDALVQLSVLDRDLSAPPDAPADGARYIVADGGKRGLDRMGGAASQPIKTGHGLNLCLWLAGSYGWKMKANCFAMTGRAGLISSRQVFGAALAGGSFDRIGVNASADATNRLALSSSASLFNHAGNGHQIKVNKVAAGDTNSLLFQTNWSGRAEMGCAGNDDFFHKGQ